MTPVFSYAVWKLQNQHLSIRLIHKRFPLPKRRTLNQMETDVLTVQQAADYLQVSVSSMRRLLQRREVISIQIGRNRRVTQGALKQYVQNLEKQVRATGR